MNIRQRKFVLVMAVAGTMYSWSAAGTLGTMPAQADETSRSLAFVATGKEYRFDTGELRGTLRAGGQSKGLAPVQDVGTGKTISGIYGLLSPYRLLTSDARFGTAAWDWASQARSLEGGVVEVRWKADREHPLEMTAQYRLAAADMIDLTLAVKPERDLRRFELFLASYFEGFERSFACADGGASQESGPGSSLIEATRADGYWQVFPRDNEAKRLYGDGRWKRPPHPVDWVVRRPLVAPLAIRRDTTRSTGYPAGLAAALMAPAGDCFAVAMPFGEESHRSVYLSLFGRDLKGGETAVTRARLVVRRGLSDEQALQLYREFAGQGR